MPRISGWLSSNRGPLTHETQTPVYHTPDVCGGERASQRLAPTRPRATLLLPRSCLRERGPGVRAGPTCCLLVDDHGRADRREVPEPGRVGGRHADAAVAARHPEGGRPAPVVLVDRRAVVGEVLDVADVLDLVGRAGAVRALAGQRRAVHRVFLDA